MSQADQRAEIVRTLFAHLSAGNFEELADLFADDIAFDTPFAPDGYGLQLVGRSPLRDVLVGIGSVFEDVVFEVDRTYPGADDETVVAEYHSHAIVKRNGKTYANRYVGIFQVRDGAISLWREYYNPEPLAAAMR